MSRCFWCDAELTKKTSTRDHLISLPLAAVLIVKKKLLNHAPLATECETRLPMSSKPR